jgi:hypothetical protein
VNESPSTRSYRPASQKQRVDAVCVRFEDAWKSGATPRLETYLSELDDADRPLLFEELLALELLYRLARKETPLPQEYITRFPEHASRVSAIFAEVAPTKHERADDPDTHAGGGGRATMPEHEAPAGGPWPQVPGYEILAELGRGGMGVVYKARQVLPARVVALKMMLAGAHASAEELTRFRVEAAALARLRHPNVVQVYEVGEHGPHPYFSMEFVPGGSLSARLQGKPLEPRLAAQLVEPLARAVHAVHQAGVFHRDLKPANVLLDGGPDTPLEQGTPRLSDFGLAKQADDGGNLSQTNQVIGSLQYMAPEQAKPDIAPCGSWTDVHGLGAILYQLLTGRAPFQGDSYWDIMRQVLRHTPAFARPRSRLERDLQSVCRKCLKKEPSKRFGSAAEVAERLQRILAGQPIPERPPGWAERAGSVLRRHLVLVGLVLLFLGAAGGIWGFLEVSAYLADPKRVREDVEARLRDRQKVTLIGETGPPGYFEWGSGEEMTLLSSSPHRPFRVSTTELALIEFPYAEKMRSYQLRALVRHDGSPGAGSVGLYCGRKVYGRREGVERSSFVCLSFADRGKAAVNSKVQNESRAKLDFYYLELRPDLPLRPRAQVAESAPFRSVLTAGQPAPWCELILEVTPKKVRAFWRRKDDSREDLGAHLHSDLLGRLGNLQKIFPYMKDLSLEFVPQGGMGLFVNESSASFQRVVLEPLIEEP